MSAPGHSVSVFHFTSKISNAKIRKYKQATERGMSSGNTATGSLVKDTPQASEDAGQTSDQISELPPAKKVRLRLKPPRPLSTTEDVLVDVKKKKKKPDSEIQFRYSQDMVVDASEPATTKSIPKTAPVAQPSSSALTAPAISHTVTEGRPAMTSAREQYGDFMSYYIAGCDETDPTEVESQCISKDASAPEPSSAIDPPGTTSSRSTDSQNTVAPISGRRTRMSRRQQHAGTRSSTIARVVTESGNHEPILPSGPPPLVAQSEVAQDTATRHCSSSDLPSLPPAALEPLIQCVDYAPDPKPLQSVTVRDAVERLERLSLALLNFGVTPEADVSTASPPPMVKSAHDDAVDNFLSHFADEADDDSDDEINNACLRESGTPDEALTYGIQFIQNALRSWAQQRLAHAHEAHTRLQAEMQHEMMTTAHPQASEHVPRTSMSNEPVTVATCDLASTPEGLVIHAFQEVLDSGYLQTNLTLPSRLSKALQHLYTQIDRLINQGVRKAEAEWRCMSYGAQIAAHCKRVERWKEAHLRAQAELALRQQHMSRSMITPMVPGSLRHSMAGSRPSANVRPGVKSRHKSMPLAFEPMLDQASFSADLGRSRKLKKTPLKLTALPSKRSVESADDLHKAHTRQRDSGNISKQMEGPLPAYLPRSGQSMRFSFAPTSEAALKAFGPDAFPESQLESNETARPSTRQRKTSAGAQPPFRLRLGDTHESPMEIFSSDAEVPEQDTAKSLASGNTPKEKCHAGAPLRAISGRANPLVAHENVKTNADCAPHANGETQNLYLSAERSFDPIISVNESLLSRAVGPADANAHLSAAEAPDKSVQQFSRESPGSASSQGSNIAVAVHKAASSRDI